MLTKETRLRTMEDLQRHLQMLLEIGGTVRTTSEALEISQAISTTVSTMIRYLDEVASLA